MLGDAVFFPRLKGIADQEAFIYANQASTADLIGYLSEGSDLAVREFLTWYLFRENIPKVSIKKKNKNTYSISLPDISFELPVEVKTDKGIERINLSSKPTEVFSTTVVEVDPSGWYLFDK
jgi:hypothetical protein